MSLLYLTADVARFVASRSGIAVSGIV